MLKNTYDIPNRTLPAGTDLAARRARWRALTPPGGAEGFLFLIRCRELDAAAPRQADPHPDRMDERYDCILAGYDHGRRHAELFADDYLPHLRVHTGTEIYAEACGCRVHRQAGSMPFALPRVADAAGAARLVVPALADSTLMPILELADRLRAAAGDEALFGLPDIQSPMDNVALIWDKTALFVAMLEEAAAVRDLARRVHDLMFDFFDEWFARHGTAYVAHYPDYYLEGGITVSEDEIGAVSPELFAAFFREHLVAMSERYGGIGVHCCADARHQWDNLRDLPGLRVLNLVNPHHRPVAYTRDAHVHFAGTCLQMHDGWRPDGPPATWPAAYPTGARVVIQVPADTIDEGKRRCDELNALRGTRVTIPRGPSADRPNPTRRRAYPFPA